MAHVILRDLKPDAYSEALENLKRGDVVKVEFPGEDPEFKGPHPAVIVSNDEINEAGGAGGTVTVVAISSHSGGGKAKPYEVRLKAGDGGLTKDCNALPHVILTIHRRRIVEVWGVLSDDAMFDIEDQIAVVLEITIVDE